MQRTEQTTPSPEILAATLVCPICWSHEGVETVEGIVLSAKAMGGRDLSGVSVYRCPRWHLFAVFNQPEDLHA
jgi:hypothetical protein